MLLNVNIPMPTSEPFGFGEPQRLAPIQEALSRQLTAITDHADFYGKPVQAISSSMAAILGRSKIDAGFAPGDVLEIPDDQWKLANGNLVLTINPPPLPVAVTDAYEITKREIQDQSGNTEILEGRANSQVKSGKMFEMMQGAAASQIGFKSQRTGDMVRRGARFMLDSIVRRMRTEDLFRIISKYPLHVLKAIHERADSLEWNVKVNVQPGAGQQYMKEQNAVALRGAGIISLQTTHERCEIDHRVEKLRLEAESIEASASVMGQQPAAAAQSGPAPAQGQDKPPKQE